MSVTIIFVIISGILSILAFNRRELIDKLIGWPYRTAQSGEYYRLFTSGLIHADYIHLFINLFVMYEFGRFVEAMYGQLFGEYGKLLYALLIVLGVIIPNTIDYFLHKGKSYYRSLGASGTVSAVLFAYVLFNPWSKIYLYGIIPIYTVLAAILFVVYSIYQDRKAQGNINHMAHLSGALFGFLFTLLLKPELWSYFIQQLLSFSF
ncbi:MAG TPA: rhomboid family intramembrane serine protease [Saprospiraceae bacterium]|nr:rhomboid family intramembrane serine protease [Saprospiraceae bacterium]